MPLASPVIVLTLIAARSRVERFHIQLILADYYSYSRETTGQEFFPLPEPELMQRVEWRTLFGKYVGYVDIPLLQSTNSYFEARE